MKFLVLGLLMISSSYASQESMERIQQLLELQELETRVEELKNDICGCPKGYTCIPWTDPAGTCRPRGTSRPQDPYDKLNH